MKNELSRSREELRIKEQQIESTQKVLQESRDLLGKNL